MLKLLETVQHSDHLGINSKSKPTGYMPDSLFSSTVSMHCGSLFTVLYPWLGQGEGSSCHGFVTPQNAILKGW